MDKQRRIDICRLIKQYPDKNNTDIARALKAMPRYKDEYLEKLRCAVRIIKGANGEKNRKHATDRSFFTKISAPKLPEQYATALKRKIKKNSVYFFTCAQNNTPIHADFWDNILKYADFRKAEVSVILNRYKNPTSSFNIDNEFWDNRIIPYADAARHIIHKDLEVLSDIKIQPTASNPLGGLTGLSGVRSCIVGHPKVQMNVVPALEGFIPKIMMTTGSVTKKNYTDSKVGKKGEFHHSFGFVIVEIKDNKTFFIRSVVACKDGSFTDLCYNVSKSGIKKINKISYFGVGDKHIGSNCPIVEKQQEILLNYFKPKHTIIHDLADGYSVNHHIEKNPILKFDQYKQGKHLIKTEIDSIYKFVDRWLKYNLVVISSNHNDWFDRYINSGDWKKDIANSLEYMEFAKVLLEGKAKDGILAYLLKKRYGNKLKIVGRNDSFIVNGILHHHGDLGSNGAKGNKHSFKAYSTKQDTGHVHSPFIEEGVYGLGTSTFTRIGYNVGASNWMNCDIIGHENGKRQHIFYLGKSKEFSIIKI